MLKQTKLQIHRDDTISQSRDPVVANLDGELALMSIDTGKYYCLNETGTRIWQLIEQPVAIHEVCTALLQEYAEVDPQDLEAAVMRHVSEMVAEDLVQLRHANAA